MLSEAMKAEGWIEHDGGPCPVPLDSRPGVMLASGEFSAKPHFTARMWTEMHDWWRHEAVNPQDNIIAYKPEATHD